MTEWVKQGNLTGPKGDVGPANEMVVGDVETLPYTEEAWVEITPVTASPPYQVISFGIPQGSPGEGNIEWDDILNKPTTFPPTVPIAWTDVSGKPATFPPTLPIPWSGLSGVPATFPPTLPIPWSGITGQPATYPPAVHGHTQAEIAGLVTDQTTQDTAIALRAPIASPTFTGDPKAPTPATSDNDTSIATTAYVKANIAALPPPLVPIAASAPSSPGTGQLWYNSSNKTLNIWTGSVWEKIDAAWAT